MGPIQSLGSQCCVKEAVGNYIWEKMKVKRLWANYTWEKNVWANYFFSVGKRRLNVVKRELVCVRTCVWFSVRLFHLWMVVRCNNIFI